MGLRRTTTGATPVSPGASRSGTARRRIAQPRKRFVERYRATIFDICCRIAKGPCLSSVLSPIPDRDFDPTEVAVSWQVLTRHGHSVVFATESGSPATADDIMLTGRGLDIWSAVPLLGRAA